MTYSEQQAEYDWLVELWSRHEHRWFPSGLAGKKVDGIDLVLLDADIAGLIQSFVRRCELKPRGAEVLRRLHKDLRHVLPSLTGEAADYFGALDELADTTCACSAVTKDNRRAFDGE